MTEIANLEELSQEDVTKHRSLWEDVWRQFRKHKGALTGVFVFSFITLAVFIGPYIHSICLLYTSPSPRDGLLSRMPSSA